MLRALVALPTVRARLGRLAGCDLAEHDLDRLAALAALHDLGKVANGFQNKALPADAGARVSGHMAPLWGVFNEAGRQRHRSFDDVWTALWDALSFDSLMDWRPEVDIKDIWTPLMAHHGSLPKEGSFEPWQWQNADGFNPIEAAAGLSAAVAGWFEHAFVAGPPLPWTERFGHAFAGLLMLADWLGSDERWFTYTDEPIGPERYEASKVKAAEVLQTIGLNPEAARKAAAALPCSFEHLYPERPAPRPAQAAMLDLPEAPGAGRIVVLEAETGSGKTEAALIHFVDLLRRGRVDGLYFALPTRAAAVQIHARIARDLKRILGEAAPPVGLAVPGYWRVDGQDLPLGDPGAAWPDDATAAARERAWAIERPKRYLAGPVMVGTVDQVLLGALRVRHAQLRSAAMLRLLLVVDECHASDPYMTEVLRAALDQHAVAGGHALLMSATLGADARAKLTKPTGQDRGAAARRGGGVRLPLDHGRREPTGVARRRGPDAPYCCGPARGLAGRQSARGASEGAG